MNVLLPKEAPRLSELLPHPLFPYVATHNAHFTHIEGKIRVRIIRGWYLTYLVCVLVFCNIRCVKSLVP